MFSNICRLSFFLTWSHCSFGNYFYSLLSVHPLHPWTTVEHNDLFSLQPIRPNQKPYIKKTLFSFLNWSIFMILLFSLQLSWSNEEPPLDQFFLVLFWAALKLQPAQIQIARFATKQQYNPPLICGLGRLQIWAGLMPDESTEFWSDVLNSSSLCSFWHFEGNECQS